MFTCPGQKTDLCAPPSVPMEPWTGKRLDQQTQGMGPVICFHINEKLQLPAAATNMKPEEGFTTELQTKLSAMFNVESRDRAKGWVFHSDNCGLKG